MAFRRVSRIVPAAVLVVAAAVLATATSAAGLAPTHARLLSTAPADGATLDTVEAVTMTFNEEPNPTFVQVRVTGPDGSETTGSPEVDGTTVRQTVVTDLPAGEHTVTFRVVSVDGHPISGTFSFETTEGPTPGAAPSVSPTQETPAAPAPTGSVPAVSAPADTVASTPTAGDAEDSPPWLLVVLAGLVLAVLVAGGLMLARPRRGTDDAEAG
jgi:methionine-rich copper-binding protein CopC